MAILQLRSASAILDTLRAEFGPGGVDEQRQADSLAELAPSLYVAARKGLGGGEIAADFIWPTAATLRAENSLRDCPRCALGKEWWLFSVTGGGDAWLVRSTDDPSQEVAFLNHDEETRAVPHLIGVSFAQWLQLADLMRQVEKASASEPALVDKRFRPVPAFANEIRAALAEISAVLPQTYPLSL